MFEDVPSARPPRPLNWKLLVAAMALVFVALPAGYLYWRHASQREAQETLRRLNAALAAYQGRFDGYPDSLARLRGAEVGSPAAAPPESARLLPTLFARDEFERDGYRFRYEAGQRQQRWAATVPLYSSYRLTAEPAGVVGKWFYYSDQSGEVRARRGRPAGPDDPIVR